MGQKGWWGCIKGTPVGSELLSIPAGSRGGGLLLPMSPSPTRMGPWLLLRVLRISGDASDSGGLSSGRRRVWGLAHGVARNPPALCAEAQAGARTTVPSARESLMRLHHPPSSEGTRKNKENNSISSPFQEATAFAQ